MSENESNSARPARFDLLAQKFLEQALEPGEAGELLAMIERDPDTGAELLDQLAVHELLRDAARSERVTTIAPDFGRKANPGLSKAWLAAAAAVAVAAVVFSMVRPPEKAVVADPRPLPVSPEPKSGAVAVLGEAVGAVWDSANPVPMVSGPLVPGFLRLERGLVRIDFFNGARVVMTGPSVLELVAQDRAICHSGKLAAEVPPQARGFVIGTPDGDVRDLGTAFGLEVGADGAAVHVFEGEVEIEDGGPQKFHQGEGVRLVDGKMTDRFASDRSAFKLSAEALAARREELAEKSRKWAAEAEIWNADPHLLARFDFESLKAPAFSLRNTSSDSEVADGTIVSCPVAEGRWPGKGALQFRNLSDRVRLDIPGEFESLSFTAWVSVQGLPLRYNPLLMTDGFDLGEVHWQIRKNGSLRVGIHDSADVPASHDSPPVFIPTMFGQWVHLAVVVDGGSKRITHYFNGKPIASFHDPKLPPLRLGPACIGNWSEPVYETVIRNFTGTMDEMTIHDRALTDAEILEMFEIGSPS